MTKIQKFKHLILISILAIASISIPLIPNLYSNYNSNQSQISNCMETTIHYGRYVCYSHSANVMQSFHWSFQSNDDVKITVFSVDRINFKKFIANFTPYDAIILSNNKSTQDEGYFNIPSNGNWYLVFCNNDPKLESTILNYNYKVVANPIFFLILPAVLISLIMVFFIVASIVYKRKKIENKLSLSFFYFCAMLIFYILFTFSLNMYNFF